MAAEPEVTEYDENERRLLAMLPRESDPHPNGEDRLVNALRAEGFFHPRRRSSWLLQTAAAVVLLLAGGWIGAQWAQRNSLEAMLTRDGLGPVERVLLLQRAGSAYVQAANAYALATARADSTAVEVASQVLLGAAQAVARSGLDSGLTPQLTQFLQPTSQTVIWF
jgi:hypothetical protein